MFKQGNRATWPTNGFLWTLLGNKGMKGSRSPRAQVGSKSFYTESSIKRPFQPPELH